MKFSLKDMKQLAGGTENKIWWKTSKQGLENLNVHQQVNG